MSCRTFTPQFKKQGYGKIINVSSACDRRSWPGWSVYSAAKAGGERVFQVPVHGAAAAGHLRDAPRSGRYPIRGSRPPPRGSTSSSGTRTWPCDPSTSPTWSTRPALSPRAAASRRWSSSASPKTYRVSDREGNRLQEARRRVLCSRFGQFRKHAQPRGQQPALAPLRRPAHEFFGDMLQSGLGVDSVASFGVCRVFPRPLVIDASEYHDTSCEALMPIDGDVIIHVAPASPGPAFPGEAAEAYFMPKGASARFRKTGSGSITPATRPKSRLCIQRTATIFRRTSWRMAGRRSGLLGTRRQGGRAHRLH